MFDENKVLRPKLNLGYLPSFIRKRKWLKNKFKLIHIYLWIKIIKAEWRWQFLFLSSWFIMSSVIMVYFVAHLKSVGNLRKSILRARHWTPLHSSDMVSGEEIPPPGFYPHRVKLWEAKKDMESLIFISRKAIGSWIWSHTMRA